MLKTKSLIMVAGVLSVSLLAGCASYMDNFKNGYSMNVTGKSYTATSPEKVQLTYQNQPGSKYPCKDYKTIGQVSVSTVNAVGFDLSTRQIADHFKNGGASVGANAVVNISKGEGLSQTATGFAIKCEG